MGDPDFGAFALFPKGHAFEDFQELLHDARRWKGRVEEVGVNLIVLTAAEQKTVALVDRPSRPADLLVISDNRSRPLAFYLVCFTSSYPRGPGRCRWPPRRGA